MKKFIINNFDFLVACMLIGALVSTQFHDYYWGVRALIGGSLGYCYATISYAIAQHKQTESADIKGL